MPEFVDFARLPHRPFSPDGRHPAMRDFGPLADLRAVALHDYDGTHPTKVIR